MCAPPKAAWNWADRGAGTWASTIRETLETPPVDGTPLREVRGQGWGQVGAGREVLAHLVLWAFSLCQQVGGGGAEQGAAASMESSSQGACGTPQPCGWGLCLPYLQDFWEEASVVSGALGAPWCCDLLRIHPRCLEGIQPCPADCLPQTLRSFSTLRAAACGLCKVSRRPKVKGRDDKGVKEEAKNPCDILGKALELVQR